MKGRTALVTGGARGCGLAFARGLAEAGADVAVFDVISPEEGFYATEKDCGVRTAYYKWVEYSFEVSSLTTTESMSHPRSLCKKGLLASRRILKMLSIFAFLVLVLIDICHSSNLPTRTIRIYYLSMFSGFTLLPSSQPSK